MTQEHTVSSGDKPPGPREWFAHLYGSSAGKICVFSGERQGDRLENINSSFFEHPQQIDQALDHIRSEFKAGRELYACAHLLTIPTRTKECAAPLRCLYADGDGASVPPEVPTPTMTVETSPGRHQFFWQLDEAVDPEYAEELNRRLTYAIGADASGWDLTQVLRIPLTNNLKYPDHPQVRVTAIKDTAYSLQALEEALPKPATNGHGGGGMYDMHGSGAYRSSPEMSDAEVIRHCRKAANAAKFASLYDDGDTSEYSENHNAADQALIGVLAFYTQAPDQLDRIFRTSRLNRPKWEKRQDYRSRTIGKALDGLTDTYASPRSRPSSSLEAGPEEQEETTQHTDNAAMLSAHTDMGLAELFARRHGENLRFCYAWGRWLVWDGMRWSIDSQGRVEALAKETVRAVYHAADPGDGRTVDKDLASFALRCQSRTRIDAMIALARSEPSIPVLPEELDRDHWLLNVANGTVNLRAGKLREHRREDLITKIAAVEYDPDATAPTWTAFLDRVLPSEGLRGFVQRATGYSLTGDTRERVLLILHGMGRNGKSTFLEPIREALGAEEGYAMKTPAETLMAKPAGGIPNDIARLKGARFVSASETEANRRLAEALVKEITGNDTISARFMRSSPRIARWKALFLTSVGKQRLSSVHSMRFSGSSSMAFRILRWREPGPRDTPNTSP